MNWINEVLIENPMTIDLKRAVRKFFGVSGFTALNAAVLILVVILYGLLMLVTATNRSLMSPFVILNIQTALICFVVPAMMHGSIAAEREKRTWELILAAPVTNAQIVGGKFIGGVAAVFGVAALMLPPAIFGFSGDPESTLSGFLRGEMTSIGFGIMLVAISLFISARSKRPFAAHLLIYAVEIVTLILWPILISVAIRNDDLTAGWMMLLHPFLALYNAWNFPRQSEPEVILLGNGFLYLGLSILVSAVILMWSSWTLQLADGNALSRGNRASS